MKTRFSILNLMIFLMIIVAGAVNAKSDSLPSGFTRDWLNSLTNENGQKLMHPEEEGDALQEKFFTGFAANDLFGTSIS